MPVRKVCSTCGGTNVKVDAWAEWNEEDQKWELYDVYDAAWCADCEGDTTIDDKELVEG